MRKHLYFRAYCTHNGRTNLHEQVRVVIDGLSGSVVFRVLAGARIA